MRQGRSVDPRRRGSADVADRWPHRWRHSRLSGDWRADVLRFWFSLSHDDWWRGGPELDYRIKQNFLKLWAEKRQLPVESFLDDPLTALAGVILCDQFPRNMFRGSAEQFATDHLALAIARARSEEHTSELQSRFDL